MNDKQLLLYKSVQNPGTFISDYISGPMNRDKTLSAVLEERAKYAAYAYHYNIFKIFLIIWTGNNNNCVYRWCYFNKCDNNIYSEEEKNRTKVINFPELIKKFFPFK